jgi:hypothetical protein
MEIRHKNCIDALRVLGKSNVSNRGVLIKRNIDEFLKKGKSERTSRWLERLRNAIHDEEMASRPDEDWSIAKDYVRSLLHRMSEVVGSQVSQREDETSALDGPSARRAWIVVFDEMVD